MGTHDKSQEKPAGTAMGRRPQSIGEEFGRVSIRDDPELGTYFLKPPKCHITIYMYRFSYWARDPAGVYGQAKGISCRSMVESGCSNV